METVELDKIITVDPGFHTAIALWRDGEPMVYPFNLPNSMKKQEDEGRLMWMVNEFAFNINQIQDEHDLYLSDVYIEGVSVWAGIKSITSARKGDLIKLAYLVGGYTAMAEELGVTAHIITAQRWKGQLNKEQVARRVMRSIGREYPNDHQTDAVGIGLSLAGRL